MLLEGNLAMDKKKQKPPGLKSTKYVPTQFGAQYPMSIPPPRIDAFFGTENFGRDVYFVLSEGYVVNGAKQYTFSLSLPEALEPIRAFSMHEQRRILRPRTSQCIELSPLRIISTIIMIETHWRNDCTASKTSPFPFFCRLFSEEDALGS
jgi:hypothetical protein